ncbi:MAG: hypothetical protein ACYC2G_01980 [Gemmatimonadaceae bacterium]
MGGRRSVVALAVTAAVTAGAWSPRVAAAQPDCFPPPSSNEARTMALTSLPLLFSAVSVPAPAAAGQWRLGFELTYIPRVEDRIATPTLCRPGKGPENTDLLPALPRPRVAVSLPFGLSAEASWVPPLRVAGVRANLVGLAVAYTAPLRPTVAMRLRTHATLGSIEAPITCDDDALDDQASECFDGTRSNDRLRPNLFGVDAAIGWNPSRWPVAPYAGVGYNWLRPRFRVNFTNRAGETDRSRVEVDLQRVTLFGGASWRAGEALLLSGELYAAPRDGVTGRLLLATPLPWRGTS